MSNTKSYQDGFNTGKNWKEDYRPGGPYKLNKPFMPNEELLRLYRENVTHIKEWFEGFDDGLSAQ